MAASLPPPLVLSEAREYYSWRRSGKSDTFEHQSVMITIDPDKRERFLRHEQYSSENDQIYKDVIYYGEQNKKDLEEFCEREVAKVQVKFLDYENTSAKHSRALADLHRVDVKNELALEDQCDIVSRINANQNIQREYAIKTRKINLHELRERERTQLEMILHSLKVPDFAKKHKSQWDKLPKQFPVKELNKERHIVVELRDYIAEELNKIATDVFKDKSLDFFHYIRNVKIIAERHPNRIGMIKVVVTFYTTHYSQLALALIEDTSEDVSPIANNAQRSRTRREMKYINELYENANQLNRNIKVKNPEWARENKIEVIGGTILATSTIKKRTLPGGRDHETHMQITENGGRKPDGTPINPDFYLSDDEDYDDDDTFIHSDIPRHLLDMNNYAIHQIDNYLLSKGKPPNSLANQELTDQVRNLKDQYKAGCYANPSQFLKEKFKGSYTADENSETTSIRIADKQRRQNSGPSSTINRRLGSGHKNGEIIPNNNNITANNLQAPNSVTSKQIVRENNANPNNSHKKTTKEKSRKPSKNSRNPGNGEKENNNTYNENILQESRKVSGSRWAMGTINSPTKQVDARKIFENFKKQKQRQNDTISNRFQTQDNSEKSDAENETHLESNFNLDNLFLTGPSSSSSDQYTQEDSQSSTQSQFSQSQNFNDLEEYDRRHNLIKLPTGPRVKRTKTISTGKPRQRTRHYKRRSDSISPDNPLFGSRKRKNKKSPPQQLPFTPITSRTRSSIKGDRLSFASSTDLTYSKSNSPTIIPNSQPTIDLTKPCDTITSTPKQSNETNNLV